MTTLIPGQNTTPLTYRLRITGLQVRALPSAHGAGSNGQTGCTCGQAGPGQEKGGQSPGILPAFRRHFTAHGGSKAIFGFGLSRCVLRSLRTGPATPSGRT